MSVCMSVCMYAGMYVTDDDGLINKLIIQLTDLQEGQLSGINKISWARMKRG